MPHVIAAYEHRVVRRRHRQIQARGTRLECQCLHAAPRNLAQIDVANIEANLAERDARDIEQIVDDPAERPQLALDHLHL